MVIHSDTVAVSNRSVLEGDIFLMRRCCVQAPKWRSAQTSTHTSNSCSFTKVTSTLVLSHRGAKCEQNAVKKSSLHKGDFQSF